MKKALPIIIALVCLCSCGKVRDINNTDKQTVDNDSIDKPDMGYNVSILSDRLNAAPTFYENTFGYPVDHPDDLYFTEPQMTYLFTEKDGVWSAEPLEYQYYIIDKADNTLEAWIVDLNEKSMCGGKLMPEQKDLYDAGKTFIVGYDKSHRPLLISDNKVYYAEGETPDISDIALPEPTPLTPVYKLDIKQ